MRSDSLVPGPILLTRMRFLITLAAWLAGCRRAPKKSEEKSEEPVPTQPGTSPTLTYPIAALTTEPGRITYFQDEAAFTTRRYADMFWPSEATVIDSAGGLYQGDKTFEVEKHPNPVFDMGRTPYRIFVRLKRLKTVDLEAARQLIVNIIRDDRGYFSGADAAQRQEAAIAYIQRYGSVRELVEGCEVYYQWR